MIKLYFMIFFPSIPALEAWERFADVSIDGNKLLSSSTSSGGLCMDRMYIWPWNT